MLVQEVFPYRSETWVVYPHIGRTLGGFLHWVVCILTVRKPKGGLYGTWYYPLLLEAMSEAGIKEMDTYVASRQNTVAPFIKTRPIMYLFLVASRIPGSKVPKQWWY